MAKIDLTKDPEHLEDLQVGDICYCQRGHVGQIHKIETGLGWVLSSGVHLHPDKLGEKWESVAPTFILRPYKRQDAVLRGEKRWEPVYVDGRS